VLTQEAPRRWWSWPRSALGFATPLLLYTLWGVFIVVNARRIAARQAADPTPAPDSAAGYFVFFMVLLSLVVVAVFLITAAVLCVFQRLRAFGIGALVGTLLPVLVAGGFLLWDWYQFGAAARRGG
jgi:hypothetical protein